MRPMTLTDPKTAPQPTTRKARPWAVAITALLAVLSLVGCQPEEAGDSPEACLLVGVYGVNPTTGACEIVPGCVTSSPAGLVFPDGWRACGDTPPGDCGGLDEPTCTATPGCQPHYTRPVSSSNATSEGADIALPYPEDPMPEPPPGDPGYLYAGCFAYTDPCAALDEQTCYQTRGCEAYYAPAACDCAAPDDSGLVAPSPDDGTSERPMPPTDCACDPIAQFAGCQQSTTPPPPPPPQGCEQHGEVRSCVGAGCEWVDGSSDGAAPDRMPCVCEEGTDCACLMPEPVGYCREPVQPPQDCYNLYDQYSCLSTRGCEWVGSSDGGEAPPDQDCACVEGDPNCGGCGGMPAPAGYCQPYNPPSGCWSYGDPYVCGSDPACVWINPDGTTGGGDGFAPPCECSPDDANCACTEPAPMPEPWGYCADRPIEPQGCGSYWDERSCVSDPACGWMPADGGGIMPCECDPADPNNCACTDPMPPMGYCYEVGTSDPCNGYWDAASCVSDPTCAWAEYDGSEPTPAPDFCPPDMPGCGGAPDPCWGAWVDERNTCRGPADEVLPDECCAAQEPPSGYCYSQQQQDPCASLPDAWSCASKEGCVWTSLGQRPIAPPCNDPNDPACGVSYCDGAALDASGQCALPTGEVAPECCDLTDAGYCSQGAP